MSGAKTSKTELELEKGAQTSFVSEAVTVRALGADTGGTSETSTLLFPAAVKTFVCASVMVLAMVVARSATMLLLRDMFRTAVVPPMEPALP